MAAPVFDPAPYVPLATNPLAGIDVGALSDPAFGDLDLMVGAADGALHLYQRTPTGFVAFSPNTVDVGQLSAPAFADLDGDEDLVVGEDGGTLLALRNTGTAFEAFATNPFAGIDVGDRSTPAFADLDGDGDLELVVGESYGTLRAFTPLNDVSFADNGTGVVFQRAAVDPEGNAVQWSLGGADAALFDIDSTGAVTWRAAPDFETPLDADGDNLYNLTVIASDGTLSTPLAITVAVTDVVENQAPAITSGAAAGFAENGIAIAYQATATDPDGGALIWSFGGADAALFQIDANGAVTFRAAPNFEAPGDEGGNNTYDVIVTASDGSLSAVQAVAITVTGVNEAPDARNDARPVNEDATVTGNVVAGDAFGGVADTDPDAGTTLTVTQVNGQAAGVGVAVKGTHGTLVLGADGSYSYVADADLLDLLPTGQQLQDSFTYQVSDGQGGTDTATLTLTVTTINDTRTLTGGNGANTLNGDGRDETISGLNGNDTLRGNGGADLLLGGNGDDRLEGGAGIDTLQGDAGSDALLGGAGADSFVIARATGTDTIPDFAPEDTIRITGFAGVDGFEDLTITTTGSTTRVAWTDGAVLLQNLAQTLGTDDFAFG